MSPIHPSFGAALALGLAAPLLAQEAPAPAPPQERVLPPIRYSLPPGEGSTPSQAQPTPPVVAVPPPVVVPTAAPTRRATPTPRVTPSARPTATPGPRAGATPSPRPAATDAPVQASESPAIEAAPAAVPSPATTEVAPGTAPTARREASGDGWLLAGVAALIVAVGGFFWWRRRRVDAESRFEIEASQVEAGGVVEAQPSPIVEAGTPASPIEGPAPAVPAFAPIVVRPVAPAALAPPTPAAPRPAERDEPQFLSRPAGPPLPPRAPIPAGTITAFRDRPKPTDTGFVTAFRRPAPTLGIELQPIRAGTDTAAGFVEFQFAFVNSSDQSVSDMMVSAWMLTANAEQDAQIAAYLAERSDPSQHTLYALQPGEHREHRATMGETFEQLHIVEAGGRRFFAPIILIDARYRAQGGGEGRSTAAFVVGRPNPANGKLLPVYVDRGARIVEGLAARAYPLPRPEAA